MKKAICFLILVSFLSGCKKEGGTILYKISYTDSVSPSAFVKNKTKQVKGVTDIHYTQFGSFITSITPVKFTAQFEDMRLLDENKLESGGHNLQLIDNNSDPNDPQRFADFTNKNTVSVIPKLGGYVGHDGLFVDKEINFLYFFFMLDHFYQEFELPVEYKTIHLTQLDSFIDVDGNSKVENILKFKHFPFIELLFESGRGLLGTYVFGNTNTTTIFYPLDYNPPEGSPLDMLRDNVSVWSDKYDPFILYSPLEGETKTVNTLISFDCENLIQVYAGNDNLPYTSDDLIVYAPNFWERISVDVSAN